MTPADWSNLVLTTVTIIGVGLMAFAVVMGIRWFFTEPDNYRSPSIHPNTWRRVK